ncbi:MAG: hypothetical protein MRY83_00965 [Flavobacteriales bacterium]|nr:hypothetical protein [Flavobacteriales bacterium]
MAQFNVDPCEVVVSSEHILDCELGKACETLLFQRNLPDECLVLTLPSGGTQTDAYLYREREFLDYINTGKKISAISKVHKMLGEGIPKLDLTDLPEGNYYCHYLSCAFGGYFEIEIVDKK